MKTIYPRDGWDGRAFRRARNGAGRSVEWVGVHTGVTGETVRAYERGRRFPPHPWRDAAALALGLERVDLGLPEGARS